MLKDTEDFTEVAIHGYETVIRLYLTCREQGIDVKEYDSHYEKACKRLKELKCARRYDRIGV